MILRLSEVTGPRSFALAPSRDRGSESERPRTVWKSGYCPQSTAQNRLVSRFVFSRGRLNYLGLALQSTIFNSSRLSAIINLTIRRTFFRGKLKSAGKTRRARSQVIKAWENLEASRLRGVSNFGDSDEIHLRAKICSREETRHEEAHFRARAYISPGSPILETTLSPRGKQR